MKMLIMLLSAALLCTPVFLGAQNQGDKRAYALYSAKGKTVNYLELLEKSKKADVILFGELHNNPIAHWLQFELANDMLSDSSMNVKLGAEMIERHQQMAIEEYLSGILDYKGLSKEIKLWPNFKTDYKPLVDLSKKYEVEFIGTNIPRILARQVSRMGIDSFYTTVNDSIQYFMAPVPIELDYGAPGYKELLEMDFGSGHGMDPKKLVQAQAIKDATMAWFITQNLDKGEKFLHFQGDFHSKNGGGIPWYLKRYDKRLKVLVISCVEADSIDFNDDWKKAGDFILVIPSTMTKTY